VSRERLFFPSRCHGTLSPHTFVFYRSAQVLPVIIRDDNIDTTAYFVCRVARHFQFTADVPLLRQLYPNVQRALAYLRSRDNASVGVPEALATSQWADWLDGACAQAGD
jgi:uncharacterized protein (DUF608 family)